MCASDQSVSVLCAILFGLFISAFNTTQMLFYLFNLVGVSVVVPAAAGDE